MGTRMRRETASSVAAAVGMFLGVEAAQAVQIEIGSALVPPQGTGQFTVSVDPQGDGVVATANDIQFPAGGEVFVTELVVRAALTADISSTDVEIPLREGEADRLPSFGIVSIDGEEIFYSGIVDNTLIVAARGDPPAAHTAGTEVVVSTRQPECRATPDVVSLNKDVVFAFIPSGCIPAKDCTGIRAILLSLDNFEEITKATAIYRCTVAATVDEGNFTLGCPTIGDACASDGECDERDVCNTQLGVCVPEPPFIPAQAADSPLVEGQVGNLPTTCIGASIGHPPHCLGDCDGNGRVTPGELLIGLDIQLDQRDVSECIAMDGDNSGSVTPGELLTALDNQLNDCP